MFVNLGLHINKNPAGTYGYVGSVPTVLAAVVPADTAAVLGNHAFRDDTGTIMMYKFPLFATEQEARDYAAERGCVAR